MKFLKILPLFVLMLFSFSFADTTIDLSEYDLPDLVIPDGTTTYSNYLLATGGGMTVYFMSDSPLTASSNQVIWVMNGQSITAFTKSGNSWNLIDDGYYYNENVDYMGYTEIYDCNYTVYLYNNGVVDTNTIMYQPTNSGGGNSGEGGTGDVNAIIEDLGTVTTAVTTNATTIVTWITNNPLVYLWVILAILIAIISFVRGFIRGV